MATIPAPDLLPAQRLRTSVLEGEITQLHRGDKHASEGDTFEIDGTTFEVVDVTERRLGELTDEDARAEGSPNLEAYKRRIEQTHGTEWNDDNTAVRHRFEPVSE
ncbi:ASCH domain-containing protein [Salinadaptatus halalkaliphilus]|uniref:ASCH domain-containing protein n=1 Tax=Salinadaptatus halalkaliphilus TaxID=2419781 RepID=A0A4S3TKU6_9EURY|nr:ASCH domain-containing protein [Salinadaptatus halalkaliphilus]THE64190.1 ASCH domain-containing protein [Salinadaptatus halalkaliphilus]